MRIAAAGIRIRDSNTIIARLQNGLSDLPGCYVMRESNQETQKTALAHFAATVAFAPLVNPTPSHPGLPHLSGVTCHLGVRDFHLWSAVTCHPLAFGVLTRFFCSPYSNLAATSRDGESADSRHPIRYDPGKPAFELDRQQLSSQHSRRLDSRACSQCRARTSLREHFVFADSRRPARSDRGDSEGKTRLVIHRAANLSVHFRHDARRRDRGVLPLLPHEDQ